MKLTDLDASFVAISGDGAMKRLPDARGAHAVLFECPCGTHSNLIAFEPTDTPPPFAAGVSRDGGRWRRTGETLADLTLQPSIDVKGGPGVTSCWHGFITNGEVTTC